ncbi:MAG: DUF222 domain-containing protein [Actinomycetota bacterium]
MSSFQVEVPDVSGLAALPDDRVMELQTDLAAVRRRVDAAAAAVAGELARRSRIELGYAGLAQRTGARTTEKLVQRLSGASGPEARVLVKVGELMGGKSPWLAPIVAAVETGDISVGAADAIRSGLGVPTADVAADDLQDAACALLARVAGLSPEKVAAEARADRKSLDENGVRDREALLYSRRYLHLIPQADGMTRVSGLLDPESAALVVDAIDRVTSPRRGGPRFVDPAERSRAAELEADLRSTEQIALDALVDMVRIAAGVDEGTLFGRRTPAVRVHVTLADLDRRAGSGHLEGQTEPVSIETVERHTCSSGVVPILFESGRSIDLGQDQRLFTARQRIALAARDGGCRFGDCDRPPSWCEAHHIVPWKESERTRVDDGVLLCRHHHMLVHNNGWRIVREESDYFAVPPRALDPAQALIPMPTRSRVLVE